MKPFKSWPIDKIFFKISLACIVPIIPATVPKIPSYSQFKISSVIVSSWKKDLIHGVFLSLKSNVKMWPSNLLIAPVTRNFFNFRLRSFMINFVLKLSDPSTIKS